MPMRPRKSCRRLIEERVLVHHRAVVAHQEAKQVGVGSSARVKAQRLHVEVEAARVVCLFLETRYLQRIGFSRAQRQRQLVGVVVHELRAIESDRRLQGRAQVLDNVADDAETDCHVRDCT